MSTMIKVFCSIGVALLEGAGRAAPRDAIAPCSVTPQPCVAETFAPAPGRMS